MGRWYLGTCEGTRSLSRYTISEVINARIERPCIGCQVMLGPPFVRRSESLFGFITKATIFCHANPWQSVLLRLVKSTD